MCSIETGRLTCNSEPRISRHGFQWGDDYQPLTFFKYAVIDDILDGIIAERKCRAQEAFNFVTANCKFVPKHTKDYWGGDYVHEGVVFASYIERKEW